MASISRQFQLRHDHALEQAGASHAIIYSGNPKIAFQDDYQMPFKPNPHFVSWVPLTQLPFSYIVYTPGEEAGTGLFPAARLLARGAGRAGGLLGRAVRHSYRAHPG